MDVLTYMKEQYPNWMERMELEAKQRDMDPVLPVGTVVYPIRNGFGTLFGGYLTVERHNLEGEWKYMTINYSGRNSSRSGNGYCLTYDTWFRDVVIVPNGMTDKQRWDWEDNLKRIFGR